MTQQRCRFQDGLQSLRGSHVSSVGDDEFPIEPVLTAEPVGFRKRRHIVYLDEVRDQANLVGGHQLLEDPLAHLASDDGDDPGPRIALAKPFRPFAA
jgi:hypothetical protein